MIKTWTRWGGIALLFGASSALAVPCSDYPTSGVVPSLGCEDGPAYDANASAADVAGFFGVESWTELDRAGGDSEGLPDTDYWSGDMTGPSGYFTLAEDFWTSYSDAMVILKDGGVGPNNSIKWAAYLLEFGTYDYRWIYGEQKDVSYLALYVGDDGTTVPEPGALTLLGLGLLALGLTRRSLGTSV